MKRDKMTPGPSETEQIVSPVVTIDSFATNLLLRRHKDACTGTVAKIASFCCRFCYLPVCVNVGKGSHGGVVMSVGQLRGSSLLGACR